MKTSAIKKAEREVATARKRLMDLQEAHDKRVVAPLLAKMVGQYWVYRCNCYSCPAKPGDYWDMHGLVLEVDGASIVLTVAQVDSRDQPSLFQTSAVSFDGKMPDGWELSTAERFDAEVRRVKKLLGVAQPTPRPGRRGPCDDSRGRTIRSTPPPKDWRPRSGGN